MTITEFLLARIAEDEAVALAANGPSWGHGDGNVSEGGLYACAPGEDDGWSIAWFELGTANADANGDRVLPRWSTMKRHAHENSVHAARHDPARVLAECKAKRAIVEFHKQWPVLVEGGDGLERVLQREGNDPESMTYALTRQMAWLTQESYVRTFGVEPPTTPILRALASVYADHPHYRQEWAL